MKRTTSFLGLFGLIILTSACSGPLGGFVTNTATLDDRGNLGCFGWEE